MAPPAAEGPRGGGLSVFLLPQQGGASRGGPCPAVSALATRGGSRPRLAANDSKWLLPAQVQVSESRTRRPDVPVLSHTEAKTAPEQEGARPRAAAE